MTAEASFWKAVKTGGRTLVEKLLAADPGLATARLDGASAILVFEFLMRHGADPFMKDDDGKTAADHARARGHTALAARLERVPWL